ncbi:MAG: hypothetical protein DMF06_04960 [Verrucomicrobia bacterium]|nr:MAG: hypothetical protein DMF06_04960 [Verrucomicrobiota bacterium]
MTRYQDQILDEHLHPVPNAEIWVFEADGDNAAMTDDDGLALANPLASDEDGIFYFNAADAPYSLEVHYGGQLRYRELIQVGPLPPGPQGPPGDVSDCATRAELAATPNPVAGMSRILVEKGREGLFVFDGSNLSAKVTADPRQGIYVAPTSSPTGVAGAWVRAFSGPFDARWFGTVGDDVANDYAAIQGAINLSEALRLTGTLYGYGRGGPPILLPKGAYFIGGNTLDFKHTCNFAGESGGGPTGGVTVIRGTATIIRLQASGTTGANGTEADRGYSAAGSIIERLVLQGNYGGGANAENHGIHLRIKATIRDVFINNMEGDGFYSNTWDDPGNNVNGAIFENCFVQNVRNGWYFKGADSNNAFLTNPQVVSARRYGCWLLNTLGSQIMGGDFTNCGVTVFTKTQCSYGGKIYYVLPNQEAGASANAPSGTNAANTWWGYVTDGGPTPERPAWVAGMTWQSGGPIRVEGASSFTSIFGHYRETGQAPLQLQGQTIVLGGLMTAVNFDGSQYGGHLLGNSDLLRAPKGFETNGNTQFNTNSVVVEGNGNPALTINSKAPGVYPGFMLNQDGARIGFVSGGPGSAVEVNGIGVVRIEQNYDIICHTLADGLNLPAGKSLKVNGVKVIGAQAAAIANHASDGTVNSILAALRAHGLIAP